MMINSYKNTCTHLDGHLVVLTLLLVRLHDLRVAVVGCVGSGQHSEWDWLLGLAVVQAEAGLDGWTQQDGS